MRPRPCGLPARGEHVAHARIGALLHHLREALAVHSVRPQPAPDRHNERHIFTRQEPARRRYPGAARRQLRGCTSGALDAGCAGCTLSPSRWRFFRTGRQLQPGRRSFRAAVMAAAPGRRATRRNGRFGRVQGMGQNREPDGPSERAVDWRRTMRADEKLTRLPVMCPLFGSLPNVLSLGRPS
jgi:hypothetical protein